VLGIPIEIPVSVPHYQDAAGQEVPYKSFWLTDTKLYWKENHVMLYTEASNIFNSRYYDFGGIIRPGIWIRGGITIDLDYKKISNRRVDR